MQLDIADIDHIFLKIDYNFDSFSSFQAVLQQEMCVSSSTGLFQVVFFVSSTSQLSVI